MTKNNTAPEVIDNNKILRLDTAHMGNGSHLGEDVSNLVTIKYKIFPNPSEGLFNLVVDEDCEYFVYNMYGAMVMNGSGYHKSKIQLNLNGFARGLYLLRLEFKEVVYFEKIQLL